MIASEDNLKKVISKVKLNEWMIRMWMNKWVRLSLDCIQIEPDSEFAIETSGAEATGETYLPNPMWQSILDVPTSTSSDLLTSWEST